MNTKSEDRRKSEIEDRRTIQIAVTVGSVYEFVSKISQVWDFNFMLGFNILTMTNNMAYLQNIDSGPKCLKMATSQEGSLHTTKCLLHFLDQDAFYEHLRGGR